jgi:hypothetical protein
MQIIIYWEKVQKIVNFSHIPKFKILGCDKYVATASCYSQIPWIVNTMRDCGVTYKSVPLMCDSSSAICLTQNPIFYGRVKHIKVRHHFLIDHVEKGDIEMKYIDTKRQLADIFTKPLDATRFASLPGGSCVFHPFGLVWGGSCVFTLYILYLIFIALHFILIYLLLHLFC